MEAAELAIQAILLATIVALRYVDTDGRISPDGQYYLNRSIGRRVPSPYAYRILLPYLCNAINRFERFKPLNTMRVLCTLGNIALLAAVYLFTLSLGGTPWQAFAATAVIICTDTLFGTWVMFPWLVDSWSLAFALFACCVDPFSAAILLTLAILTKEVGWLLGSAFILITTPTLWWVPLPALACYLLILLITRPAPPDQTWLAHPFREAQLRKLRNWFSYKRNLLGLKASPFVIAAYAPQTPYLKQLGALVALAWLQNHVAQDQGRLLAACTPFVIPIIAIITPDWVLSLWVLTTIFWPFSTEWI